MNLIISRIKIFCFHNKLLGKFLVYWFSSWLVFVSGVGILLIYDHLLKNPSIGMSFILVCLFTLPLMGWIVALKLRAYTYFFKWLDNLGK